MKKQKTLAVLTAAVCMATAVLPVSASNYENSKFGFQLPARNGWGVQPGARAKEDYSISYVHYTDGPWDTIFMIFGSSTDEYVPDMNNLVNCTVGGSAKVGLGEERAVRQNVKEWKYTYAYIGGSSEGYPEQYAIGVWSPDSIGYYPEAN